MASLLQPPSPARPHHSDEGQMKGNPAYLRRGGDGPAGSRAGRRLGRSPVDQLMADTLSHATRAA
jgi:hypothetical protein